MLENAISSVWLSLLNFLVALREKVLQQMGKFLDWFMNRKTKDTSAGRPTVDDPSLSANRDSLVWLLSVSWGDIGWQLPRATTREELKQALKPLEGHPSGDRIARFVRLTSTDASAEEIRKETKVLGKAIERLRESQSQHDKCADEFRQAEWAMSQTKPEQVEIVKAELSKRRAKCETAQSELDAARVAERALEQRVTDMEASFAQDELLKFIKKRFIDGEYARHPLNFANAIAGLPNATGFPFLGVWQSYARCSKLECRQWPHFQFRVFETIESIWKKCQVTSTSPVELFRQQIRALPKTVLVKAEPPEQGGSQRTENYLRTYLLDNSLYLKRAIERTLEADVEPDRMPFVIFSNFGKILAEPRTAADSVLAAAERID